MILGGGGVVFLNIPLRLRKPSVTRFCQYLKGKIRHLPCILLEVLAVFVSSFFISIFLSRIKAKLEDPLNNRKKSFSQYSLADCCAPFVKDSFDFKKSLLFSS